MAATAAAVPTVVPANRNPDVAFHPVVLAEVRDDTRRALDAGCGVGMLASELRQKGLEVVGLDRDASAIGVARNFDAKVQFVLGDVCRPPFGGASFDLVASIAMLHHVDARQGLRSMATLVRPGGVLVVIGLARSSTLLDLAFDVAGVATVDDGGPVVHCVDVAPKVWPPQLSYRQMRQVVADELPGAVFRRRRGFRYTAVWTRPASE